MTLVVILTVRAGREAAFEAYASNAASRLARHGGRVERRVVVAGSGGDAAQGGRREVHVVTFPGAAAFASYRDDPETRGAAAERDAVIAATEILTGEDAAPFSGGAGS